jgi:Protein of unknown function (DUF2997)
MEIVFTYDPQTGQIITEAIGYQGKACLKATKPFEDALGTVNTRSIKKEINQVHSRLRTKGENHAEQNCNG